MLDGRKDGDTGGNSGSYGGGYGSDGGTNDRGPNPTGGGYSDMDDEIPF